MVNRHDAKQAGFSIGTVSRLTGINVNTLRAWEKRYHLKASRRTSGGQREYSPQDLERLKLLSSLLDSGMKIGEIAPLSVDELTALLDPADVLKGSPVTGEPLSLDLNVLIVGASLSSLFEQHIKRYPNYQFSLVAQTAETWLDELDDLDQSVVILQLESLNEKHIDHLQSLIHQKVHVIVAYLFSHQQVIDELTLAGVEFVKDPRHIHNFDVVLAKVENIHRYLIRKESFAAQGGKEGGRDLVRLFSEQQLLDAEKNTDKLLCECPSHLSDLIRRLNAFERYTKSCQSENWKQAAIHESIFEYTSQARYLIEKALVLALNE